MLANRKYNFEGVSVEELSRQMRQVDRDIALHKEQIRERRAYRRVRRWQRRLLTGKERLG